MNRRAKTSRIKMKFAVTIGVIIMCSLIFFSVLVSAKERTAETPSYKYYTSIRIEHGDTLWTIAESYCYDSGQMKEYVKELKEINGLKKDEIHAGSYLTVMYYSDEYK